jgi:hypothetical protein
MFDAPANPSGFDLRVWRMLHHKCIVWREGQVRVTA